MSKKEVLCEDIAGKGCGLKRVLDIIGGKWKILNSDPLDPELDEWPGKGPNGEKQK